MRSATESVERIFLEPGQHLIRFAKCARVYFSLSSFFSKWIDFTGIELLHQQVDYLQFIVILFKYSCYINYRLKCLNIFLGENIPLKGCYREAVCPLLVFGQFFGLMPLIGVSSHSELHFKWKSLRTFYSLIVITILVTYSLFLIWRTFNMKNDYSSIGN